MFHNVLMTTLTPLSNINEIDYWENRPFTNVWPCKQQQQKLIAPAVTKTIKKKKRNRTSFSSQQLKLLEKTYTGSKYLDRERRHELANLLGIADNCIKIWFQNRRMKEKKESSDSSNSSCESYSDSMSPLSQTESEDLKQQNVGTHTNFNMDNTMTYHQLPNGITQNHYTAGDFEIKQPYFNNTSSVQYSFYNDTNTYPTQYYPYNPNEFNFEQEPNYQYYEYNSDAQTWPEDTFNLSYL